MYKYLPSISINFVTKFNGKKQEAQKACIAHLSFNEKHTSYLITVTCKSQRET